MNLRILINRLWNVCIWYAVVESTLGYHRPQPAKVYGTISSKSGEQRFSDCYRQYKLGYVSGHGQWRPQISGVSTNRINRGCNNLNCNDAVKGVDEQGDGIVEEDSGDIGRASEAEYSNSGGNDGEVELFGMMANRDLAEIQTERKIKIPYVVEYPTDRVSEEQDMTKEDVARSIMTELGFFYPRSSYTSFKYYGDTTRTFTTADKDVEGDDALGGSTDSNLASGDLGESGRRAPDKVLVGSTASTAATANINASSGSHTNNNASGGNHTNNNSGSGSHSNFNAASGSFSSKGQSASFSGTGDVGSVTEEEEERKSYLVKTTLMTKLDKKEEDSAASILDEQESPVVGHQRVRWFPNYVSRSLRKLHDYLKYADLILDVRDGRVPFTPFNDYFFNIFESEFPMKPRITVFTHADLLPRVGIADWLNYYRRINKTIMRKYNENIEDPSQRRVENRTMFVDSRNGVKEIVYLRKHIYRMTRRVRERSVRRGMRPRGVRVIVVGMPNVGKSSLINRLLGRRAARTTGMPGTTRDINVRNSSGNSVRGYKRLVLIDTPGIITPLIDMAKPLQTMMLIYSGLNIIGESACEEDEVAIVVLREVLKMLTIRPKYIETSKIRKKYPLLATMIDRFIAGANRDWLDVESEISYNLDRIATWLFGGNLSSCCSKMLKDFRRGKLGHVMLQAPPYLSSFSATTNTSSSSATTASGTNVRRDAITLEYSMGAYEGW
ncbi:uncharacterized protein TOT_040000740 [Theileria orientalis strain Shintoku]|uniref:G domain-containing protein n=1 Tax=Theileria orientalis strain Shintoku TaxID=869250 RepID=J7M8K4_THEOR|nr:uncharacterized protein TOT_040000740 [Theileria orientalis strain Shintoku]BAM42373.1 uncharacterized protein TOT_040000740 [Theileria orientalis strain Shintoku]|eukprot:XP_009692674.1 uncharacterized protein TOT_040000740 [Theileria orientalis strain Shintoku]